MRIALVLVFLSGAYPVWLAWRANRTTSLAHATSWMAAAWLAWLAMMVCYASVDFPARLDVPRYLALSLTGCASVAVLGARRPGIAAWNFVVLGLLAVLLLPLVERFLATGESLSLVRKLFVAGTVAIGIVNYLPTGLWSTANLFAWGVVLQFMMLDSQDSISHAVFVLAIGLCPWQGLLSWHFRRKGSTPFDRVWLDFRDRYGLVWSQRVREQFNRAAANAGWSLSLCWGGLRAPPVDEHSERVALDALQALLKRFYLAPPERGASAP